MRTACISLLLLSLATIASAEGNALTFDDASLDAMPPPASAWADIVGASLTLADDETLVATVSLTALPEFQPGVAYVFVFSAGDREWYLAAFTAPTLMYAHGPWTSDEAGPGDFHEATGSYTTGPGATVTIEMPVSALDGAPVASAPRALSADIKTGILPVGDSPMLIPIDVAEGAGELALPAAAPAPSAEPVSAAGAGAEPNAEAPPSASAAPEEAPMRVPAMGALAAIGAMVGAFVATRRRA